MTEIEISTYVSRDIIVKNKTSKTKITFKNNRNPVIGVLQKADNANNIKTSKTNIWNFKLTDGSIIEINGEDIKTLETL